MPQIGEFDEEFLLQRAAKIVEEKTKDSTVFDVAAEKKVPTFHPSGEFRLLRKDHDSDAWDMRESSGPAVFQRFRVYVLRMRLSTVNLLLPRQHSKPTSHPYSLSLHTPTEITDGKVLGKGGFCTVFELAKVKIDDHVHHDHGDDDDHDDHHEKGVQDRNFIASKYLRKGKDARYAIKKLSADVMNDPNRFVAGIIDLAIESRFLAVIKHPNIIKMRAKSDTDPYKPNYFVVLDRLFDTLNKRFGIWAKAKAKTTGLGKLRDMKGKKKGDLWIERLLVAYDLAAALRYLHGLSIVYRDLKPDNIGFDVRGDVKIFDFGLAKEITQAEKVDDDLYKMSGNTGSLRYMAPEVALEQPWVHKDIWLSCI